MGKHIIMKSKNLKEKQLKVFTMKEHITYKGKEQIDDIFSIKNISSQSVAYFL
jgi:hypothetical protein